MSHTAVITGGAGFIGCGISQGMVDRFDEVIVIDNLHPQIHKKRERPMQLAERAKLVVGDIADAAVWSEVLDSCHPDVVIHLAAETGTGQSLTESSRHAMTNVVGTTTMLDAFSHRNIFPGRIVLTSSRAVYGEGAWLNPVSSEIVYPGQRSNRQLETLHWDFEGLVYQPANSVMTRPMPVSVYGATKLAQENIITSWAVPHDVDTKVLRLQNVYGPGQSLSNPYTGIVSLFCQLARDGKSIPVYEDGRMLRDFILIDDVAAAILASVDCYSATPAALDIGTGNAQTIGDIAQTIAAIYGAPEPHVCQKYRFGDVRHASCLVGDAMTKLNWKPQVDVAQGLHALQRWIELQLKEPFRH